MCEKATYYENCPECGAVNNSTTRLHLCETAFELKLIHGCFKFTTMSYAESTHLCRPCWTAKKNAEKEKDKK